MVTDGPNRAERRRIEREAAADQGIQVPGAPPWNLYPRTFDKCPFCGCPARFAPEALKGEFLLDRPRTSEPAMGSLEFITETPTHTIKLIVVVDSCAKCGMIVPVARDKIKKLKITRIPPGHGGRLIGRG